MNCIDNLPKCGASCCKTLAFTLNVVLSKDQQNYYKYHGCKLIRKGRTNWQIIVPVRCEMLDENLMCKLHGTDKKPNACKRLSPDNTKGLFITDGCLLKDAN